MLVNNPRPHNKRASDLRSTLKKRQILDGARQIFLLNGYAGARMDEIAVQAGVSKGTLYNHFDSKNDLFKSLIHAEADRIKRELPCPDLENPDPVPALMGVGIAILEVMEAPATVATLRLIIGALGRFPRLGEEFLTRSSGHMVTQIAEYFDTREAAGDSLKQAPRSAAEQFARWCLAHALERVLVPWQLRRTDVECSSWVKLVLGALAISTAAHRDA